MLLHTHSFRKDLFSKEKSYSLSEQGITVDNGNEPLHILFKDIEQVRISGINLADMSKGVAIIKTKNANVEISSLHFKGLGRFENRSDSYAPFIQCLLEKVHYANPNATFVSGNNFIKFFYYLLFVISIFSAVLLFIASIAGEDLRLGGGASLFALAIWVTWNGARSSHRQVIDPLAPPENLLYF